MCVFFLICFFVFSIFLRILFIFFFFNDTATTEIYTLSLHDALPISRRIRRRRGARGRCTRDSGTRRRSEEHTSELQSPTNLVCRLLLEKKNNPATTLARPATAPTVATPRPRARPP